MNGFNTYIFKSILLTEWQDTDFCLSINSMKRPKATMNVSVCIQSLIYLIPLYHRPLSKITLISRLANKFNVEIQTNNDGILLTKAGLLHWVTCPFFTMNPHTLQLFLFLGLV